MACEITHGSPVLHFSSVGQEMWQVPVEIYLSYHVSQDCKINSTYLTLPRKYNVTNIRAKFNKNCRKTDRQTG
jgi:hypothetical protein